MPALPPGDETDAHHPGTHSRRRGRDARLNTLERLAGVIRNGSLCGLGQTAPNPVLTTLRYFRDEYEAHVIEKRCPGHVCKSLITFSIHDDNCNGCTLCARACPADAILGSLREPHHILFEKCIRCGACLDACNQDAILVR